MCCGVYDANFVFLSIVVSESPYHEASNTILIDSRLATPDAKPILTLQISDAASASASQSSTDIEVGEKEMLTANGMAKGSIEPSTELIVPAPVCISTLFNTSVS